MSKPLSRTLLISVVFAVGFTGGWMLGAVVEARQQAGRSYETFRKEHDQLEELAASARMYETRLRALGEPRSAEDVESYHHMATELAIVRSHHAQVAARYNAAQERDGYRFCDAAGVPEGAQPLPRQVGPLNTNATSVPATR